MVAHTIARQRMSMAPGALRAKAEAPEHVIVIRPQKRNPRKPPRKYKYEARCDGRFLCVSTQPFFDGCRKLIELGLAKETDKAAMRHDGSDIISLRSTVGRAAGLTVDETNRRFAPYKAKTYDRRAQDARDEVAGGGRPGEDDRPLAARRGGEK